MAKGIYRKLDLVLKNLRWEMKGNPDDGKYARGLRSEGYLGGYRQAILDVDLALRGGNPVTWHLWDDDLRPPVAPKDQQRQ